MAKSKVDEKWDAVGDNPLVIISESRRILSDGTERWASEVSDFLDDEAVDKVLEMAIKIMGNDIPQPAKIASVCARLEAYAIKFRMQYSSYMSFKKGTTEANAKKNHYKELYTGIDRLVDSLKYVVR